MYQQNLGSEQRRFRGKSNILNITYVDKVINPIVKEVRVAGGGFTQLLPSILLKLGVGVFFFPIFSVLKKVVKMTNSRDLS